MKRLIGIWALLTLAGCTQLLRPEAAQEVILEAAAPGAASEAELAQAAAVAADRIETLTGWAPEGGLERGRVHLGILGAESPAVLQALLLAPGELSAWPMYTQAEGLPEPMVLGPGTVTGAEVRRGEYLPDTWEVLIEMNPAAAEPWAALTRAHIGKHLALVLDGRVYSAPRVMSEISGGKLMITGNFSRDEARELAALLQQAPLPLKLRWVSP